MQIPLTDSAKADKTNVEPDDITHHVASDIAYERLLIVNVAFVGVVGAGDGQWVLVDAGIPGMSDRIIEAADKRFSSDSRPAAILLTHGHFDHVGSLEKLAEEWDVPIYAHTLELPYLNGKAAYPPPDPLVGGGMMSLLSPLYPRGPINVSDRLVPLPEDGSVPCLPGWQWFHTPGHTPGHVSFWRQSDRTLLAGDAFITTGQESAYAVATQRPEMHGPPMYYTQNWSDAAQSVRQLAALDPELVVTGHGQAMRGPTMRTALNQLAQNFNTVAIPKGSEYVTHPASSQDGSAYVLK